MTILTASFTFLSFAPFMEPEWSSTRAKLSGIRTWAIISVGWASNKTYASWLPPVTGMYSFPTWCVSVTSPGIIYSSFHIGLT